MTMNELKELRKLEHEEKLKEYCLSIGDKDPEFIKWIDSNAALMKVRDRSDTEWVVIFEISDSGKISQGSEYFESDDFTDTYTEKDFARDYLEIKTLVSSEWRARRSG